MLRRRSLAAVGVLCAAAAAAASVSAASDAAASADVGGGGGGAAAAAAAGKAVKVCVVGGGIGGAATARFLRTVLAQQQAQGQETTKMTTPEVHITVFDKNAEAGGRTKSFPWGPRGDGEHEGRNVEVGASILYTKNYYVRDMADEAGLTRVDPDRKEDRMALWDGKGYAYKDSSLSSWFSWLSILWRYKYDLVRMNGVVNSALDKFMTVYDAQDKGMAFETAADLWKHVGLHALTQQTTAEFMAPQLSSPESRLLRELIFAVNKVNYNQGNEINALAGVVSLCPLVSGTLFKVKEGNCQVSQMALEKYADKVKQHTEVTRIAHDSNRGGYAVWGRHVDYDDGKTQAERNAVPAEKLGHFDAVVLAVPFQHAHISVDGAAPDAFPSRPYQRTVSTFVLGRLNGSYFGHTVPGDVPPEAIMLTADGAKREAWASISDLAHAADAVGTQAKGAAEGDHLYKIFSADPLSKDTLRALFADGRYQIVTSVPWRAYPHFQVPETLYSFKPLGPKHRVYNVNALETAVSALEISAIGGRNVAHLLARDLGVDPENRAKTAAVDMSTKREL